MVAGILGHWFCDPIYVSEETYGQFPRCELHFKGKIYEGCDQKNTRQRRGYPGKRDATNIFFWPHWVNTNDPYLWPMLAETRVSRKES